ncbi:GTP 3',8-cyclase MoaA [Corallincola platygyrae]|uniref:GTP 3',8-cyclase n=1 Tax=Corallincola platygyrae TaxID=1193278 RepID=A0ABW4XRZ1_9GAMM
MKQLQDGFGRKFYYLRLSVTDVCNFRCQYCLPDGYRPNGRQQFLTQPEVARVTRAFAALGTQKVRLTGGEPTLRKDFCELLSSVAETPGIKKVALTTNGYRLAKHAKQWRDAGLTHLNVSVDSLDPRMFHQITGENLFHQVMAGIDAALDAGFESIKVNSVLLKGLNDKELVGFLDWVKQRPVEMRFIELMQTGEMDSYFQQHHQRGEVIKQQLLQQGWQQAIREKDAGPAERFWHPDYEGGIGLIMPYSKDFCAGCNRLRVSALGKLHLCLFGEAGVELRDLLGADEHQAELVARLQSALQTKRETHFLHDGDSGVTPHLASIGG